MKDAFSTVEPSGAVTRRNVMGAMIAVPATVALPGAALAGEAPRQAKLLSIIARKSDLSPDGFRHRWLGTHGPMARTAPGIGGLILSEPVQSGADRVDGMAHLWYQTRAALRESMAAAQTRDWMADGDLFIDRQASRDFLVNEQIVIAPPRAAGGIKRTALLVRKPGLTHAQFMAHWTERHAEMAAKVPGLVGCVHNRIETVLGGPASPLGEIDGIAEYWWDSGAVNLGDRVTSPQWAAWSAHGDHFIDRTRSRTIVSLDHVLIAVAVV